MSEVKVLSNDLLKSVMEDAVVYRGPLPGDADLNDVRSPGSYTMMSTSIKNTPQGMIGYGTLRVSGSIYILQEFFYNNGAYYFRMFTGDMWHPWTKATVTTVS